MPIRINLLAEQQAAEDLRRRDPVKRGIWVGALVVALVLLWSGKVQFEVITAKRELEGFDARWRAVEKLYNQVTGNRSLAFEVERKLAALNQLAAERFLWALPLDALQKTVLPNVQVTKIAGVQSYVLTPPKAAVTNATPAIPAKPALANEKIALTIEARDYSQPSDQNILKYRQTIEQFAYFKANLITNGVNLLGFSEPQPDESDKKKMFVSFTLECRYPEKARK